MHRDAEVEGRYRSRNQASGGLDPPEVTYSQMEGHDPSAAATEHKGQVCRIDQRSLWDFILHLFLFVSHLSD